MKSWFTLTLLQHSIELGKHCIKQPCNHTQTWRAQTLTHTHIYTCRPRHTDACLRETWRDGEADGEQKRQCSPSTSLAAGPDVDKSSPFSTGIHPQTACPPRRPLALQPTTAHLLPLRWNLTVLLCFTTTAPAHSTWMQPILIPEKKMVMEGEGRRREARKDGERRRPSGEKTGEGDVPVGSRAPNNLPADWPDSFHSPAAAPICCSCYCSGLFVQLYI